MVTAARVSSVGVSPQQALEEFLAFIGRHRLVGYHISFGMDFILAACFRNQKPVPTNRCLDLLSLARRKVYGVPNYKLETLLQHFSLLSFPAHRAAADCKLELQLYEKLKE